MSSSQCKTIDLRGQICPSTLLTALREVNSLKMELKTGDCSLLFLSDNRNSVTHISDAVGSMGYQVTVVKEEDYYRVVVCRQG
ncbi:sulfurtransferase TusA family protein [Trichlorobacter lovleyi]|uniref:sulfurtransferase TusA family protein n=1 Tax=Trichlorobacter lovleyi TaxID=313985 RepID=UPI002240C0BC|nr:sulfurtransferase TusA family protein [Trichlorobacter lovleyi]QOX78587.1 sulfurtransferase TusA family protein [Trichlorobacter lovleyi]